MTGIDRELEALGRQASIDAELERLRAAMAAGEGTR